MIFVCSCENKDLCEKHIIVVVQGLCKIFVIGDDFYVNYYSHIWTGRRQIPQLKSNRNKSHRNAKMKMYL